MPVDSGWPASRFAALLDNGAKQNQDQLDADLQGYLSEEHKANGQHGDVISDSLTVIMPPQGPTSDPEGKVILEDEDGKQTELYRARALDTMIDMLNGQYLTFRNTNYQGTIQNLVRLGFIQHGSGTDPAIKLFSQGATFDDWAFFSGTGASSNPALIIGNGTTGIDPLSVRYRSAVPAYELMKHVGGAGPTTEEVNLGSDLDSSAQGYYNKTFTRRLSLQTVANTTAWAGEWIDIGFNSGDYGGHNAMTWTNITTHTNAYMMVGPSMTLAYSIVGDVGGTPSDYLQFTIPGGYTVSGRVIRNAIAWCDDAGTVLLGYCQATVGDTFIRFYKGDLTNWAGGGVTSAVYGQITFSING